MDEVGIEVTQQNLIQAGEAPEVDLAVVELQEAGDEKTTKKERVRKNQPIN